MDSFDYVLACHGRHRQQERSWTTFSICRHGEMRKVGQPVPWDSGSRSHLLGQASLGAVSPARRLCVSMPQNYPQQNA